MAPDPENPIPRPGFAATLLPGLGPGALVLNLAHDAYELFGRDDADRRVTERNGYRSVSGTFGPPTGHEGAAADAEQNAAKALAEKTETLKSLDAQLRGVADQILDNNSEAKKKLEALAADVEKEMKYLEDSKEESSVKNDAVTQFLGEKSGEIIKVLTDAAQDIEASRAALGEIGQGYDPNAPGVSGGGGFGGGDYQALPAPGGPLDTTYPGAVPEPGAAPGGTEGQTGSEQQPGIGETLGQAASALPQALGGLTGGGSPLGDLGSTIGSLVGRAAENQSREDRDSDSQHDRDQKEAGDKKKADEAAAEQKKKDDDAAAEQKKKDDEAAAEAKRKELEKTGAEGGGTPPPPPAPAPTLVTRPDGSPAQAANSAVAAAARAHLGGADIGDAYKAAGMTLPPPGTVLKDTIPPGQATMGDLAMFKDKWVMLLGDNKVYVDGQMQPASVLGKMPGFMGFTHPPASIMPTTTGLPVSAAAPAGTQQVAAAQT